MTDIVEQLRNGHICEGVMGLRCEAADEIERLQEECGKMASIAVKSTLEQQAEIERLRHEEMRLRTALDYHVNELRGARREIDRLRGAV